MPKRKTQTKTTPSKTHKERKAKRNDNRYQMMAKQYETFSESMREQWIHEQKKSALLTTQLAEAQTVIAALSETTNILKLALRAALRTAQKQNDKTTVRKR